MKSPRLITAFLCMLAALAPLRANNGPGEGPPGSGTPTSTDPDPEPPECPEQDDCDPTDPVVLTSGKFYYPATDVLIPGRGRAFGLNLKFFRSYSSQDNTVGVLGWGWVTNLDVKLQLFDPSAPIAQNETGGLVHFSGQASVTFADGHTGPGWEDLGWTLELVAGGEYEMVRKFGLKYRFNSLGQILYIDDPVGNRITYNRTAGRVSSLTDSTNRVLTFTYAPNGYLFTVTDPQLARTWTYTVVGDNLTSVTFR